MQMKKVLIVSGHSNIQHDSVVNSLILKQVKQTLPEVEIDSLCELYPDFKIDVAAEQAKIVKADIIVFSFLCIGLLSHLSCNAGKKKCSCTAFHMEAMAIS